MTKWMIISIVILIIIIFIIVKKQNDKLKQDQLAFFNLQNAINNGSASISNINQQHNAIGNFINSPFVTTTSGIFGQIWGLIL